MIAKRAIQPCQGLIAKEGKPGRGRAPKPRHRKLHKWEGPHKEADSPKLRAASANPINTNS